MQKRRTLLTISIAALLIAAFITPVMAAGITIDPANPIKSSDGIFKVDAREKTQNVHVLLVITKTCYDQLTGPVNIAWTAENGGTSGNTDVSTWHGPVSGSTKIPQDSVISPFTIKQGGGYTAASCRDHLGVTEDLYYAWIPTTMILDTQKVTLTIKVPTDNVNMLVYLVGQTDKAKNGHELNSSIPPTPAGLFVVPEYPIGALAAVASGFAALVIVKIKKR